ncbi:hypothetical protein GTZ89_46060, partial [Streptomyces sp. SID8382]|uniref:hypothetical protein n=1 Tax=Streptomyces malaysiensis TaxID=92644 RepID=UPI001370B206
MRLTGHFTCRATRGFTCCLIYLICLVYLIYRVTRGLTGRLARHLTCVRPTPRLIGVPLTG